MFLPSAIMNKAINIGVQVAILGPISVLLSIYSGVELLSYMVILCLTPEEPQIAFL